MEFKNILEHLLVGLFFCSFILPFSGVEERSLLATFFVISMIFGVVSSVFASFIASMVDSAFH